MDTLTLPAEQALARACGRLDGVMASLLAGRAWFLRTGGAAIVLALLLHTPSPATYVQYTQSWGSRVMLAQIEHPLAPLRLWRMEGGRPVPVTDAAHLEKLTFRLTIPLLGKIFGTGKATWAIFSGLSGLIFFPLLARAVARWTGDRLTAAYLTLAFAASWAGGFFFNDRFFGDGVAWLLLFVAVTATHPAAIFAAVLAAGFTDERALLASAAVLLFWNLPPMDGTPTGPGAGSRQRAAVLLAWAAYLAGRLFLATACDLSAGHAELFTLDALMQHAMASIPGKVLAEFRGIWPWLPLGWLALHAGGRRGQAAAYAGIGVALGAAALAVYDLERSLGYLVALLPVAFRAGGLSPVNRLRLARLSFLCGLVLIAPWLTPLRYVFRLFAVPVE